MPFVIDIDPVAFTVLGIPVRWYGLILVVAIVSAVWIAQREAGRRGISAQDVTDGTIWVGIAASAGGRLLFVVQNDLPSLVDHPAHVLMVWMGGLSFYGGLIGGAIALAVFARRRGLSLLATLDVTAPAAAIGQAIGHVGCLIGGDSYGITAAVPWAVIYRNPAAMAPQGIPIHPTQAYEAILLALLFAAIWLWRARLQRLGDGVTASAYLLGLSVFRFGLFFLRDEAPLFLGLKTAQWLGVAVAIGAVAVFIVARERARSIEVLSIRSEGSIP